MSRLLDCWVKLADERSVSHEMVIADSGEIIRNLNIVIDGVCLTLHCDELFLREMREQITKALGGSPQDDSDIEALKSAAEAVCNYGDTILDLLRNKVNAGSR